VTTSIFS